MPWKVERRKDKFVVLREDGKLVAEHDSKKKAMAQMRALYASEYWMRKGRARQFASRSEAGRYAAHIRWANNRGEQPMSLEQWRSTQTGVTTATTAPELEGMDLVRARVTDAQAAMAEVQRRSEEFLARGIKDPDTGQPLAEDDVVYGKMAVEETPGATMLDATVEEWERASSVARGNFVLSSRGELVPTKQMIEALEKVKAAGSAIEAEAQKRAAGQIPDDYINQGQKAELFVQVQTKVLADAKYAYRDRDRLAARMVGESRYWQMNEGHPKWEEFKVAKQAIADSLTRAKKDLVSAQEELKRVSALASPLSEARIAVLKEIRPFGSTWDALQTPQKSASPYVSGTASPETLAKPLREVLRNFVPTGMGETLNNVKTLRLAQVSSGGYFIEQPDYSEIGLPTTRKHGAMSPLSVAIHELTHAIEYSSLSRVHPLVAAFREDRRFSYDAKTSFGMTGVPVGAVGHVTHRDATPFGQRMLRGMDAVGSLTKQDGFLQSSTPSYTDKFGDPYAGRKYTESGGLVQRAKSNEQLTVGIQAAVFGHEAPSRFGAVDSDHISFALGVWATA